MNGNVRLAVSYGKMLSIAIKHLRLFGDDGMTLNSFKPIKIAWPNSGQITSHV